MMLKKRSQGILRNSNGFTLTELMVVVGIGIILFGFSYAGFSSWQKKERIRSATYQLCALLKEARFRSIEQDDAHTVKAVDNATTGTKQLVLLKDAVEIRRFDLGEASYSDNKTGDEFEFHSTGSASCLDNGVHRTSCTLGFKNNAGFYCNVKTSSIGRIKIECKDDDTYGIN